MKHRIIPSSDLRQLADLQAGVVTSSQAAQLGLTRHAVSKLVADGHWFRIAPGVLHTHWQPPPWLALAWAGVLYAEPDARIGGDAAAYLNGLTDEAPDRIVVLIPSHRRLGQRWPWTFQRERLGVRSPRSPGSPPRLTVEDTVLDLCTDQRSAVRWITTAVQRRRTTPPRLRQAMQERTSMPARAVVSDLLTDTSAGVESPLEHRYLHRVERAHGLPRGTRQVRKGRSRGRRDIGYSEFGLLVELDGHLGHDGQGRFRDMRRDNEALMDGLVTLRYGWIDVTDDPCAVAAQVAEVMIQRGWAGMPTPCNEDSQKCGLFRRD